MDQACEGKRSLFATSAELNTASDVKLRWKRFGANGDVPGRVQLFGLQQDSICVRAASHLIHKWVSYRWSDVEVLVVNDPYFGHQGLGGASRLEAGNVLKENQEKFAKRIES
jgi:hypothetical protein